MYGDLIGSTGRCAHKLQSPSIHFHSSNQLHTSMCNLILQDWPEFHEYTKHEMNWIFFGYTKTEFWRHGYIKCSRFCVPLKTLRIHHTILVLSLRCFVTCIAHLWNKGSCCIHRRAFVFRVLASIFFCRFRFKTNWFVQNTRSNSNYHVCLFFDIFGVVLQYTGVGDAPVSRKLSAAGFLGLSHAGIYHPH